MGRSDKSKQSNLRGGRIVFALVSLFLLSVLGFLNIPNFPFGPYSLYGDMTEAEKAAPLPYSRLADSDLSLEYKPEFRPDPNALSAFPGVRDCLIRQQRDSDKPDLRLIDWNRIQTEDQAEICLWWIFLSLETPERAEAWMSFHGLPLYEPDFVEKTFNSKGEYVAVNQDDVGARLSAHVKAWDGDEFRFPNRGFGRLFRPFWSARFFMIEWDKQSQLQKVSIRLETE